MRKTKMSPEASLNKIKELEAAGWIRKHQLNEPHSSIFSLSFIVISKYGRNLFYPIDDQSKFIICHLLKQKTATHDQLKSMREFGWDIQYEEREIQKP